MGRSVSLKRKKGATSYKRDVDAGPRRSARSGNKKNIKKTHRGSPTHRDLKRGKITGGRVHKYM